MIDYGLAGRVAIVTGASRGIGKAVARALAGAGARVGICARNPEELEASRRELAAVGAVVAVPCDVRSRESVDAMVATVRECFGPISILVNNAGITSRLGLSDITDEHWDDVMSTNVKGLLYACQAVVGDMKAARWGRILNCSSYGARHSRIERGVYSASKAALNALTQIWAGELGSYGITVNAYAPGDMKTEMMADVLATPAGAALTRNIVLGRLGEPEEVADVVLYLASERASYLTGAIIEVTGGKFVVQNPHDAWPTPP